MLIMSDRRIHITAEGVPVEPEDPLGVELLVGKGCAIDSKRLELYGITEANGHLTLPSEAKAVKKADNKAIKEPTETK
jgi:hypothetical protein